MRPSNTTVIPASPTVILAKAGIQMGGGAGYCQSLWKRN